MDWPSLETNPYLDIASRDDVRVRGTRVSLCVIVEDYLDGHLPEQMVLDYPTLSLEAVYGVVAYYLGHRDAVDAHVAAWRRKSEDREKDHSRLPVPPVVARLREIRLPIRAA